MVRINQIFLQVLEMGWKASFVIIFILLVRGIVMRNLPKKYVYILWLVVGVRLVCPLAVPSSVSLFNLSMPFQSNTAVLGKADNKGDKTSDSLGVAGRGGIKKNTSGQTVLQKAEVMQGAENEGQENENGIDAELPAVSGKGAAEAGNIQGTTEKVFGILAVVWIFGIVFLLFWNLYLTVRIKCSLRKAVLYQGNVYECDGIPSPFVMGVFRPQIYIPFRLGGAEREYILKHEEYHIRRRDYLIKFAAFLITTVYWFHPLVWVSYLYMVRDMEMSCDEHVLAVMGKDIRQDYSRLLLAFATNQRHFAVNLLTFGETDTRKRVKNIMKLKKNGRWTGAAALLLLAVAGTICLTNGKAEGMKEGQDAGTQGGEETAGGYQYPAKLEKYKTTEGRVLARSTVNGYQLQLVTKDAKLVEDKTSPYNNMYEGKFVLETMKNGEKCNELPLDFFEGDEVLYFPQKITLHVKDYNSDGIKNDFILGQLIGSSNMAYQIYEINGAGNISQYDVSTEEQSYFVAERSEYSPEFECKGGQLRYKAYNQEEAKAEENEINVIYVKSVKEQLLSSADTPEHRIMAGLEKVMPKLLMDEVYQSDWRISYRAENTVDYSIANKRRYDDVTMRLDFSYLAGVLIQYTSKGYGFVLDMPEDRIDDRQAARLVQNFAEAFLGKKFGTSDIRQKELPSRYEGGENEYAYFKDTLGGGYLVDIKHNVLIDYYAAEG